MSKQQTPFTQARHNARYSHKPWIAWVNRQDEQTCAKCSAETIKRAMLDVGTQGYIYLYDGGGFAQMLDWWTANNLRRQNIRAGNI
jgi:hypothetical protein